jgi:hypothetical protein
MGVREGGFTIFGLDEATKRYVERPRSAFFPALDFAVLARYVPREDTLAALREFAAEVLPVAQRPPP